MQVPTEHPANHAPLTSRQVGTVDQCAGYYLSYWDTDDFLSILLHFYPVSRYKIYAITFYSLVPDFKKYDWCWATHEDERLGELKRRAEKLLAEGKNHA